MSSDEPLYGFPAALMEEVNDAFPGNAAACGLCGDTILGGRHRVIDAIRERLVAGESDAVAEDYDLPWYFAWVAVAASYEHDKALKRQARAQRRMTPPTRAETARVSGVAGCSGQQESG